MGHSNQIAYGDNVRTRTKYGNKGEQPYEVVEERVSSGTKTKWVERKKFGHMSDDFAVSNAREYAQALARANLGGH